jgi:mono/diheme cytochrome c family protein
MEIRRFRIIASVMLLCSAAAAQDVSGLYKAKCASCHGATGAGKPAMKGSNLLSDNAKNMSDAEMEDAILHGGKSRKASHAYSKKGVSADQATALVAFIRAFQK